MRLLNTSAFGALVTSALFAIACNVSDGPTVTNTTTDPCQDVSCSGHGQCEDTDGVATCVCDANYQGSTCGECADGLTLVGDVCQTVDTGEKCTDATCVNGTCDDTSGTPVCTCDEGFGGDSCDACATGYLAVEDTCVRNIPCSEADPCGDYGTCQDADTGATCACDAGYIGSGCDECATTHYRSADGQCVEREICATDTCNNRGTCTDVTGVISCACDATFGGDRCETCYPGFVALSDTCVPAQQCQAGTCFGNGTCDDSTGFVACTCNPGYASPFCDGCAVGHTGTDCLTCENGYVDVNGVCTATCADSIYVSAEACDDGNTDPSNGTTDFCSTDCGFTNWPSGSWPGYIASTVGPVWAIWSNMKVNNNGSRYGVVAAGSSVTISGNWAYDKAASGCAGCVTQLYLGFFADDAANTDPLNGKPQWCQNSIQTQMSTVNLTFTAPTEPGTYYLRWSRSWLYSCDPVMANYGSGANLFAIYVE